MSSLLSLGLPKGLFPVDLGLHVKILKALLPSPNIVRVIKSRCLRWAGCAARMEEGRSAFKFLTGKPTGKRPLGRPRRRWGKILEWNIKK